jgi:hypothetical protein
MAGAAQRRHIRHVDVPVTARSETAAPDLACLLAAQQIPVVHTPFDSASLLAVVAQAASPLPAATPDQRLSGT